MRTKRFNASQPIQEMADTRITSRKDIIESVIRERRTHTSPLPGNKSIKPERAVWPRLADFGPLTFTQWNNFKQGKKCRRGVESAARSDDSSPANPRPTTWENTGGIKASDACREVVQCDR